MHKLHIIALPEIAALEPSDTSVRSRRLDVWIMVAMMEVIAQGNECMRLNGLKYYSPHTLSLTA